MFYIAIYRRKLKGVMTLGMSVESRTSLQFFEKEIGQPLRSLQLMVISYSAIFSVRIKELAGDSSYSLAVLSYLR